MHNNAFWSGVEARSFSACQQQMILLLGGRDRARIPGVVTALEALLPSSGEEEPAVAPLVNMIGWCAGRWGEWSGCDESVVGAG